MSPPCQGFEHLRFATNHTTSGEVIPSLFNSLVHERFVSGAPIDSPRLKWSALRYGFRPLEDGRYGEAA